MRDTKDQNGNRRRETRSQGEAQKELDMRQNNFRISLNYLVEFAHLVVRENNGEFKESRKWLEKYHLHRLINYFETDARRDMEICDRILLSRLDDATAIKYFLEWNGQASKNAEEIVKKLRDEKFLDSLDDEKILALLQIAIEKKVISVESIKKLIVDCAKKFNPKTVAKMIDPQAQSSSKLSTTKNRIHKALCLYVEEKYSQIKQEDKLEEIIPKRVMIIKHTFYVSSNGRKSIRGTRHLVDKFEMVLDKMYQNSSIKEWIVFKERSINPNNTMLIVGYSGRGKFSEKEVMKRIRKLNGIWFPRKKKQDEKGRWEDAMKEAVSDEEWRNATEILYSLLVDCSCFDLSNYISTKDEKETEKIEFSQIKDFWQVYKQILFPTLE